MFQKHFYCALSVLTVTLFVAPIRCHIPFLLEGQTIVPDPTIEVLNRNISEFLDLIANIGVVTMKLQNIYSASMDAATGTIYNLQAQLATPDGPKNCQITVNEQDSMTLDIFNCGTYSFHRKTQISSSINQQKILFESTVSNSYG